LNLERMLNTVRLRLSHNRLLRARRHWQRCRAAEQCDEGAPL
jgi:hypothetical protein